MFRDARKVAKNQLIERDVCIIGGGAAGITLACELSNGGAKVALIESGDIAASAATQALYRGSVAGGYLPAESDYLSTSRLRFFGGTTNHWAGLCGRLAPIDFEQRSWIPHSGWPFDREHLDPYYERARPILQLGSFDPPDAARRQLDFGPGNEIKTIVKQYSPPTRFGPVHGPELKAATNVEVFLRGNATELRSDPASKHIEWVRVATLSGNHFRVAARTYVLAAGGIENARLLLASNRVQPNGIGNSADLVGRFFMDHWYRQTGVAHVVLDAAPGDVALYTWPPARDALTGRVTQGRIVLSDATQRQHRLPNNGFGLLPLREAGIGPLMRSVGSVVRDFSATGKKTRYFGGLSINLEPLPDPSNRISLSAEVDALGMPRTRLHWDLTENDRKAAIRSLEVFATELGRSLRGRVKVQLALDGPWTRMSFSSHHIGTTRMHEDPRQGVVDANARVHGVSNLYVAGSSVFPTAGLVNPTLTIVALAIRLADHLKSEIFS